MAFNKHLERDRFEAQVSILEGGWKVKRRVVASYVLVDRGDGTVTQLVQLELCACCTTMNHVFGAKRGSLQKHSTSEKGNANVFTYSDSDI